MYKILLILIFSIFLNAQNLKIASYNVENFFDLNKDKSDYKEYIPNSSTLWNQRNFNIKLNNILKVLNDLNADIIALQEIENESLMKLLKKNLPQYSYYSFTKYQNSSVGLGFLSKIPIKSSSSLNVKFSNAIYRPILESTFQIDNIEFKIFNNHWPSKRASENHRIKYAKTLYDRVKTLPNDYDYIILGDLNSNYNEFETFKGDKKLNQTAGLTGINHILKTTVDDKYVVLADILNYNFKVHYNLWLDLKTPLRFSTKFRNQNNTPDNIIIPPALFDNKNLSYILNSFEVFKPNYLFFDNKVYRWQMSNEKISKHKGAGFSDHLPVFAYFSIKKDDTNPISKKDFKHNINLISDLYKKEKLLFPITLEDVTVIYKYEDKAIVKQDNNRAIYIFKDAKNLKIGFNYDIQVNQVYDFYGLKEIKDFNILKEKNEHEDYKKLFLDGFKIDIFDFKYENEIITNLVGTVNNSRLILPNKKSIKLFAKDKTILPKNGAKIELKEAHLASFKGNMQIIIHKTSDYKEIKWD